MRSAASRSVSRRTEEQRPVPPQPPQRSERGQRSSSTEFKKNPSLDTYQEEALEEVTFPPGVDPARVQVTAGVTRALGDFEFMRMDVSVTLPCMPTQEGIEDAYERASDFAAAKLDEEQNRWLGPRTQQRASRRN